jgi:hypothetical protein
MKINRLAVSFIAALPLLATANNVKDIKKDLEVMEGVFVTSISKRIKDARFSDKHIDAVYLRGQGVVYTITNPYESWRMHIPEIDFDFDFSGLPAAPAPPAPPEIIEQDIEMEVAREWEHSADLHQKHMESMQNVHAAQREMDDIKFEISQAVKDQQQALKKQLKAAESHWQQMKERLSDVEVNLEKFKQKQQAMQIERAKKKSELIQSFVEDFEAESSYVLCRFGGGLRSLPADESLAFVLKAMGDEQESGERSDLIYSFTKEDVLKCASGKLKENALVKSAQAYSY